MITFVLCFISLLKRHIKPSVQLETAKRKPRFREEKKNEEIISRNCQIHHKRASSFTNTNEAVQLHFLPMLSRYSQMSKTVQHAGTARHSTIGDVFAMQALPVTPRWRVNILIFRILLHVSNLRVHIQEDSCIYRYGSVCFTYIGISSLVGRKVC